MAKSTKIAAAVPNPIVGEVMDTWRRVTITGLSPLLMHGWTQEATEKVLGLGGARKAGKPAQHLNGKTPRDVAEQFLWLDPKGRPAIPRAALFACLREGGNWVKVGKRQVTTRDSSFFGGAVYIVEDWCPIVPGDWEVEVGHAANPNTKQGVVTIRPRFDRWETSFTLGIDQDVLGEQEVRACVDHASKKIGLGSSRLERKGLNGRFIVKCWEEIEMPK